ncbi:unnamed protein product [Ceutorhynchus assimilis]|uniref:Uncharacterized protein n=1 Tax=Ceutorhynchus assimilis TaxID=467358 RepID=A0A9P0GNR6_9CUCU|nr:unnamed protein product [Ceutorhynchus assimilis]
MNNHATSITGNPTTSDYYYNTYNSVKQETNDDPEIRELAAKFVEANKAKMAAPAKNQVVGQATMNLISFLTSDKLKNIKVASPTSGSCDENRNIDEESAKGRFGWTSMGKIQIPYIIRLGENYCSVRMVEMKVLNKWLNYLHQDLYNCTNIRSYYITETEARLFNEINLKHCDYQFGREQFTSRDLIVRLVDANEFYQFLGHCYHKLVNTTEVDVPNRCGFIRINRESVVPYTVYNSQKYVPLFYFEGETDNLKLRADKIDGWDLSYLKFCCKVQGIRNELFAHDSCSVISLNDIKNYFPPGTVFEDYWPKKNLELSQLLISGRSSIPQNVHWTRQPAAPPITTHPPPSPKPATQAKAATNGPMHSVHLYSNNYTVTGGQSAYHIAQPRAASSAIRSYPSATRQMRPAAGYYTTMIPGPPPPPLLRAGTSAINQSNTQKYTSNQNYMVIDPQAAYHQPTTSNNYPQPPLLQHMNGTIARYEGPSSSNYTPTNSGVNQNPAHQASSRAQTSERPTLFNNGKSVLMPNQNATADTAAAATRKLTVIPESSPTSNTVTNVPYKMQKAQVQGKMLNLINMKAYVYTDYLVTLQDLVTNFFMGVTGQSSQQVLQVLGIEVYKANAGQMQVLLEQGKCTNVNETVPLVQIRNVIEFMPQLKYMLSGMVSESPSKIPRNS